MAATTKKKKATPSSPVDAEKASLDALTTLPKKEKAAKASKAKKGRSLVIVESPTKQKTIAKFLGNKYTVLATYGHIRDLPARTLGVDEKNNFEPQYVILPKARKVMPAFKEAIKNAEKIYLATDFDREGESIAWHVAQALKLPDDRLARITFHRNHVGSDSRSARASP